MKEKGMKKEIVEEEDWIGFIEEETIGDQVIYAITAIPRHQLWTGTGPSKEGLIDSINMAIMRWGAEWYEEEELLEDEG